MDFQNFLKTSDLKALLRSLSEPDKRQLDRLILSMPIEVETAPKWFHKGQREAWETDRRIVLMLAGTQSGKTVTGARLLLREIQRTAKPGEANDYLIVGPDTELLKKKALPEFMSLVMGMADYRASDKCFVFTRDGSIRMTGRRCAIRVFVGYGFKPDALEAATYKAIWLDECGQAEFVRESWEALQRRAAINRARMFLTTTPYTVRGWLKDMCDDALAGRRNDVSVVRFRSIDNPAFPREEFERARHEMPAWRFSLFYEGEFSRPAGAVYDSFENRRNVVVPFDVPAHWPRHIGVDFGETNTAAVFLAEDPNTLDLYAYGSYHAGGRSVEEHVRAVRNKALPEGGDFDLCVGGSWSEAEWRKDYIAAGLPVARPPVREVEVGIQRVYRQIKTGRLKFFDSCARLLAEVESYSREVDDRGEPLDTIRDKAKFHRLDALRYIVATLRASAEFELVSHSRLGSQARIL